MLNGIVVSRTDDSIRLRLADGKEVQVAIEAVEQEKPGKSLMPEGNVDPRTKQELVDLVTFLSALGRVPEFTVSTKAIVRSFETLIESPQELQALAATSRDIVAKPQADLAWRPVSAKVNGPIPMEELDSLAMHNDAPNLYVRFMIDMPDQGVAALDPGTDQFLAWVDAKPTRPPALKSIRLGKGPMRLSWLSTDSKRRSRWLCVLMVMQRSELCAIIVQIYFIDPHTNL